jgi:putative ABC transport system permease protein
VETSYAKNFGIQTGDFITVAGKTYPVAGIVDASRAAKIAVAHIYLPMAEAQKIAAASKHVQTVSTFGPEDANILFIKAKPGQIDVLARSVKDILGKKTSVATPVSFLKQLGNLFALSDKFTLATSLIAMVVTVLIVLKTMAGHLTERAGEIGILKAVGWSNGNVVSQIVGESVLQCFLGCILGLVLSLLAASALGFMEVNIPIPWEMSPTPHFLAGGGDPIFKTLRLPVHISWRLTVFAITLSMLIGAAAGGFLSRHISRIKPSEVLRYE